jgi:hypothetical protein
VAEDDWNHLWNARVAALESVLGPSDGLILTSPVPFWLDGSPDVLTFREHLDGVAYVTASLIGDDRSKPSKLGQYELMICLREPDDWAPGLISWLAKYTIEAVLSPGDTVDIKPAPLPQPTRLAHFLFVPYAAVTVEGQRAGVLLCLGITQEEYDCLCERGNDALLAGLKQAGIYPFTDPARAPINCDH